MELTAHGITKFRRTFKKLSPSHWVAIQRLDATIMRAKVKHPIAGEGACVDISNTRTSSTLIESGYNRYLISIVLVVSWTIGFLSVTTSVLITPAASKK